MASRPRLARRCGTAAVVSLAAVAAVAAAGCARSPALPRAANPPDVTEGTPVGDGDPCRLLQVQEVELALNVSIAGTATGPRTRPALAGMEMCSVRSDGSVASWGVLAESAAERFRQYEEWNEAHLVRREVAGHRAVWDEDLRTLVVLAGSRAVAVRLTVEQPPGRDGADLDAYVEREAARLAARALARLRP